jgi:RND superfamily putative drug exporter
MSTFLAPLGQRRTYAETADITIDLVVGVAWFSIFTTLVATGVSLLFALVGLPILAGTFLLARAAAALERRRARAFLATQIETPKRAEARGDGLFERLMTPLRDRTTWKELFYVSLVQPTQSVVNFSIAATAWFVPLWALTLPIYATHSPPELWTGRRLDTWREIIPVAVAGLILLPLAPWVIRLFAAADRAAARWGLSPRGAGVRASHRDAGEQTGVFARGRAPRVARRESESDPAQSRPRRRSVASLVSTTGGGTTMSRAPQHSNLAAGMGRWSAAHWKTATFGWLAFVLVSFGLGAMVGTKQVDQNAPGPGESGRMQKILDDGFKQPVGENVLIQSRSHRVGDPSFGAVIRDVAARVSTIGVVQNVHRGATSKDGHSALVDFEIRGDRNNAADKVQPVLERVGAAQRSHPGFVIGEFGLASAMKAGDTAYGNDLGKAGTLSLPITLIILVLTFGALVAAGIPLLLGLTAVVATFGLIALPSHLVPVALQAYAMVLLIGLAVGVDYSMFYLKRERQERAAGRSREAALAAAAATSGRSVLISGVTVMTAMAGMFMTRDQTFASLAFATILVVAVAVLGSLTVLPAVLSRLGDKVDRLRVPVVGRRRRGDGEGGVWSAIVDRVLRRPALSALLAAGLLLALAAPALQLHLAPTGVESFPQSLEVIKTYKRMQAAFPGTALPANVVVKAPDVEAPAVRAAIEQLERRALASGRAFNPITADVNKERTVADITIPIAGNGTDAASNAAFHLLRHTLVPETVGAVANTEAGVTGVTAMWKDAADKLESDLPPVVGFVLLLAFGLMLVAFRSVVIAVKAILLNLLSVAAAYGVLVLVFQHGFGKGLLGGSKADGIDAVVPLLLFVILFGLSMDYHVFIISRIREAFDRGMKMDQAVAHGIKSTAGVVTSAATVMVCVFAVFTTLSVPFFKQFGVGLSAAILIDATIVRAVLLPATMKLLGDWNWYLPRWLEWLPRTAPDTAVEEDEKQLEAPATLIPG